MSKLSDRDKEMLTMLSNMETRLVAEKLGITERAIYSRLHWLRKKKKEAQTFVNQLNNYANASGTIKKLLIVGERKK